jgi:hypothetical protein
MAALRGRLGRAALALCRHVLADAREASQRRGEGPTGGLPLRRDEAAHAQWRVLRQLFHREQRAEVVRDRVEAAGVHDPRAGLAGPRVVLHVHAVDELGLAGQVDVVGAMLGTGRDQRLPVLDVRANGGDHDARLRGQLFDRGAVGDVGVKQRQVTAQALTHGLELALVAPCKRDARRVGRIRREVRRGQATGEPGAAEHHDVVVALSQT